MTPAAKLAIATKRLNRLTDDLEAIADWRDDLHSRIIRASLRFELVGLDEEEQDALAREVSAFAQVCRCMVSAASCTACIPERMAA